MNNQTDKVYANPSYDKSLTPKERLADFLGAYHLVLNGVVKHDPFEKAEVDGGGMCCDDSKLKLLDFVEELIAEQKVKIHRQYDEHDPVLVQTVKKELALDSTPPATAERK